VISRNLLLRVAFAVPAIALALVVVWQGAWVLAAVLGALGVLGVRELYDLARRDGVAPLDAIGYIGAAAIPFAAIWAQRSELHWAEPLIFLSAVWLLAVLVAAMIMRGPQGRPLTAVAVTIFGCLYASALLAFVVPIRHGVHSDAHPLASTALVGLPLAVTWTCDTCAMAVGTLIGGPKLSPVLSPHKTWSGAVGGVVGAIVAALVYGSVVLDRVAFHLGSPRLIVSALVIAIAAQVGDAAESLLKREAGLKDSSSLIPGHGGVLDRLDSLYFVLPVTAGLFRLWGVI
jgi:phosphatidate cytidylyltransferase